jgi:hypothetical protein
MGDAAVSYTISDVSPLRLDSVVTATRPVVLFIPRALLLAARSR